MTDLYRINLESFEGPMDLLLYLIKKNDVDIYDIPIAFVTEEYLKYIDTLKELDIDFASEFLEMAAELAHIKSQMLLPKEEQGVAEDEIDPRADLVRRLIEYQRYKEAAIALNDRPVLNRDLYSALLPKENTGAPPPEEDIILEGNAFLLLEAFNQMLAKLPKGTDKKSPTVDRMNVNERILQIAERLHFGQTMQLIDLLPDVIDRHMLVVSFLALLEMAALKMIKVYQAGKFEMIYITGAIQDASMEDAKKLIPVKEEQNILEEENGNKPA